MFNVPKKVSQRLTDSIKNFQPILKSAYARDINETDTVTIVKDILSDVFGYDKYLEITGEFQIRSTYCDLATIIDKKINLLIEVKAIGISLKENHIKQATDYASNEGVDWVILTNGVCWQIYKMQFGKPVTSELVFKFDFTELNPKKDIDLLYPLTREGATKSTLDIVHTQRQALSRFSLGALIMSDQYLNYLRRDIRKISPDVKVDIEQIKEVIATELFKREVVENPDLVDSLKKIVKISSKPKPQKKVKISTNYNIEATQNTKEG